MHLSILVVLLRRHCVAPPPPKNVMNVNSPSSHSDCLMSQEAKQSRLRNLIAQEAVTQIVIFHCCALWCGLEALYVGHFYEDACVFQSRVRLTPVKSE